MAACSNAFFFSRDNFRIRVFLGPESERWDGKFIAFFMNYRQPKHHLSYFDGASLMFLCMLNICYSNPPQINNFLSYDLSKFVHFCAVMSISTRCKQTGLRKCSTYKVSAAHEWRKWLFRYSLFKWTGNRLLRMGTKRMRWYCLQESLPFWSQWLLTSHPCRPTWRVLPYFWKFD